jgi:hypothetical protein
MIAPKKGLQKAAAEVDLAATLSEPKQDEVIKSKRPRARGRARAEIAKNVATTIHGPSSKRSPKLAPGVRLVREYKGRKLTVLVIDEKCFEFEGRRFKSLSALACSITKQHMSGMRFFGLTQPKVKPKKSKGGTR